MFVVAKTDPSLAITGNAVVLLEQSRADEFVEEDNGQGIMREIGDYKTRFG